MKVSNKLYSDPSVQVQGSGGGGLVLYKPNLIEKIKHALGKHWSYGQPFCVVCGLEEIKIISEEAE